MIKWNNLNKIANSFIGKSIFIISLTPIVLNLIKLAENVMIKILDNFIFFEIGSLFILISFLIIAIYIPNIIKEYGTVDAYKKYCFYNINNIDFILEFKEIEKNKSNIEILNSKEYKIYIPLNLYMSEGNSKESCIQWLCEKNYELINSRYIRLRLFTSILLILGIILINIPLIKSIIYFLISSL